MLKENTFVIRYCKPEHRDQGALKGILHQASSLHVIIIYDPNHVEEIARFPKSHKRLRKLRLEFLFGLYTFVVMDVIGDEWFKRLGGVSKVLENVDVRDVVLSNSMLPGWWDWMMGSTGLRLTRKFAKDLETEMRKS
ncbi:hypothetical protein FKW77_003445 [Venturia effusa]|uniref:Uncharacterized protein n=1 Tax=Venturia effusa TaxID=50376 RepID=A0A517KW20_9PEZI|nr:hypothetical protein FKW77_003445 [Venturia effusa]